MKTFLVRIVRPRFGEATCRVLFLLIGTVGIALAQVTPDSRYQQGRRQIKAGDHDAALESLAPLLRAENASPYAPYAFYFSALAHYREGRHLDAQQLLLRLIERFPYWDDQPEAYYLLGCNELQRGNYDQALQQFERIRPKDLRRLATEFKTAYLEANAELNKLKALYESHPDDEGVGQALATRLASEGYREEDRKLLADLRERFKLKEVTVERRAERKDRYRVAVLFPFQRAQLTEGQGRSNQFVLDYYAGLQLAAEELRQNGVNLDVFTYDTERDASRTRAILTLPELRNMDLLIGPVYQETAELAGAFARSNRIPVINPLSVNQGLAEGNPFVFLAEASPQSQARRAADYALSRFPNGDVLVLAEETGRDTAFANTYARLLQAQGRQVRQQTLSRATPQEARSYLREASLSGVSHLVVASTSPGIAASVVTALEVSRTRLPVLVPGEWLVQARNITFEQWERQNVHFLFDDYVDTDGERVQTFSRLYTERNHLPPSAYSYQGYNLLMFFGEMLQRHGTGWPDKLRRAGFQAAPLASGFDYSGANVNQFVPIVRVQNEQLTVVNMP